MAFLENLIKESRKGINLFGNAFINKPISMITLKEDNLEGIINNTDRITKERIKFNLKDVDKITDKEKILKELSENIKTPNKEDELKKDKAKNIEEVKSKKEPKPKKANALRRAYLNSEDKYYNFIEKMGLTKITDKIDKIIPSFIIFILLILLILAVLVYFLWPSPQVWSLGIHVIDSTGSDISDANIVLSYKDKNIISSTTDVFGEVKLSEFSSGKKVIITTFKSRYILTETEFSLSKKNNFLEVTLEINTNDLLFESNSTEKIRNLSFVENNSLLVVSPLSVTFNCSSPNKTPDPSYKNVNTGKVTVKQVAGCGELKVSVTSDNYESISKMIVPVDDKINLTKISSEKGQLTVKLKNLSGNIIPDALIKTYAVDSIATIIDESEFILKTGNSDMYGRYVFDFGPGSYLTSVEKIGYLSLSKQGPYNVITNNNTLVEYTLITPQELIDFNCSKPKYQPFCINGHIDCNNPIFKPFITMNPDGTCILGVPGYIDVSLKDSNSLLSVSADISLLGRLKDTNQAYHTIETKEDINRFNFNVVNTYDYRIQVSNTEVNGYIQPDAIDTNGIDKNITILLDYSSEINSGTIGVNVNSNGYNIANSQVYLFRMDESGDVLVNPIPKLTGSTGDVNFYAMRAGRDYYAFAIQPIENLQGTSDQGELDANEFLELEVNLENTPRILNLKVIPNDFNISFYTISNNEEIISYLVNELPDGNKQYIFTEDISQIYAILRAEGYASYQTELIKIIPGQEVYRAYTLTSFENCSASKIELIGLYNASKGDILVSDIDFNNHLMTDEYKLKFKFTSCLADKEFAYAHIRTGSKKLVDNDSLSLVGVNYTVENVVEENGFAFQGELTDWNLSYYNLYNAPDHAYSWTGPGQKWVNIDFTDSNIDVIEFSVDFNFKGDISQLSDYLVSYRSLSFDGTTSYLYPIFSGYNNWSIVPEGYFYAKTDAYLVPFSNTNYILDWSLTDLTGNQIVNNGDAYIIDIGKYYKYNLEFLHLLDQNKTNVSILEDSVYTAEHLLFNSYTFKDNTPRTITGSQLNSTSIDINDINSGRGYNFDLNSVFFSSGFFEVGGAVNPKLNTNIYNNFARLEFPMYAYYEGNSVYLVSLTTNDITENNNIYFGSNDINFFVTNNSGVPLEGVKIKYSYSFSPNYEYILGTTDGTGSLLNQNLIFDLSLVGNSVYFIFVFDANAGYNGCFDVIEKEILSGYSTTPDLLNYNADVVSINGINQVNINTNEYNIVQLAGSPATLSSVNINTYSELINVLETNIEIQNANNLPNRLLTNQYTPILAPITLSSTGNFSNQVVVSKLYNDIFLGNSSSGDPISQIMDTNVNIFVEKKGDINFTNISYEEGIYFDNDNLTHIELIKNVVEDLNLDYNITGFSENNSLDLKINKIIASASSNDINLDYINSFLETNYSGKDINSSGIIISVPFKLLASSNIGFDNEINLDFNFGFGNNYSIIQQNIYVDVYDNTNILIGELVGSNLINCNLDSCEKEIKYKLTNKLKSYNIRINSLTDINQSEIPLQINKPISGIPEDVNKVNSIDLIVSSNYDYFINNGLNYYFSQDNNLVLDFGYTIKGISKDINKTQEISININPENALPPELGIKDNLCIGSGGLKSNNNLFIFASCEDRTNTCQTGSEYLPKVKYCWSALDCTDVSWSGLDQDKESCISDSSEYNTNNKFYCDSLQMLFSVLTRLSKEPSINNVTQSYYVYLLADGTSEDLISDFMHTIDDFGGMDPNFITDIKAMYEADPNNFTITRNENEQYKPGLYSVTVNYSLDDSKLDISLIKEQDLLSTELSLFYYLPIDGKLGTEDSKREGYGARINYGDNQSNIKVLAGQNYSDIDLNSFNYDSSSKIVINANNYSYTNIDSPYFKNLQLTSGTLMDLSLENTSGGLTALNVMYSLSRPVPVYSRVGCLNNSYKYVLKETNSNDVIPIWFSPLITWDYNISNSISQADDIQINSTNGYDHHEVNLSGYITIPANLDYSVLKTMIYLPVGEDYKLNPETYKLSINGFSNSLNSKLYNINSDGNEVILKTNMGLDTTLVSIQDLFNLISSQKACIYNGSTSTTISWNVDKININEDRINEIINNAATGIVADDCSIGNIT